MQPMIHKQEARILYILAKNAGPVRKRIIGSATARWGATVRDGVLDELERRELIEKQSTPGEQSKRAGYFYWLTDAGLAVVASLHETGVISPLPENWRQHYGSERHAGL